MNYSIILIIFCLLCCYNVHVRGEETDLFVEVRTSLTTPLLINKKYFKDKDIAGELDFEKNKDWMYFKIFSKTEFDDRQSCWITSSYTIEKTGANPNAVNEYKYIALAYCEGSTCVRGVKTLVTDGDHTKDLKLSGVVKLEVHCKDIQKKDPIPDIKKSFKLVFSRRGKEFSKDNYPTKSKDCNQVYVPPTFWATEWDGKDASTNRIRAVVRKIATTAHETYCEMIPESIIIKSFPVPKDITLPTLPYVSKLYVGPYEILPFVDTTKKGAQDLYRFDVSSSRINFEFWVLDKFKENTNCIFFADLEKESDPKNAVSFVLLRCNGLHCQNEKEVLFLDDRFDPLKTTTDLADNTMTIGYYCQATEEDKFFYSMKLKLIANVNKKRRLLSANKMTFIGTRKHVSPSAKTYFAAVPLETDKLTKATLFGELVQKDKKSWFVTPYYLDDTEYKEIKKLKNDSFKKDVKPTPSTPTTADELGTPAKDPMIPETASSVVDPAAILKPAHSENNSTAVDKDQILVLSTHSGMK